MANKNSTLNYVGLHRNLAMFESRGKAVLVDTKSLTASIHDLGSTKASKSFVETEPADVAWREIAEATLASENIPAHIPPATAVKRTYTVPKRVSELAARSSKSNDNLSPVTQHVSALLASGNQIPIQDVLWVSRFFASADPNNTEVYEAWGGEDARRWATSLATRLNYDSTLSDDGYFETPGVEDFTNPDNRFYAMLDKAPPHGHHVITLYKKTPHGTIQAWGNGDWIDCDEPHHKDFPRFVELDEEAALYVAGALFDSPEVPVDIKSPNPEAYDLALAAYEEIDWDFIDSFSLTAAGTPAEDYTPEQRSNNAANQLRDANGRFIVDGAGGVIKSTNTYGTVVSQNVPNGTMIVDTEGGQVEVPSADFESGATPEPKADPEVAKEEGPSFDGILAPMEEEPQPKAFLSYDPEILSAKKINTILENYEQKIVQERFEQAEKFDELLEKEKEEETPPPITAAGEESPDAVDEIVDSMESTPDNSNVSPIYLAIVDKDDPRSVMEFVALVPATSTSSEPKTFRRAGGRWVEDLDIIRDLKSATPPPVIQISEDEAVDILEQVDNAVSNSETREQAEKSPTAVAAAGGLDRNRGNAEALRRYWTVGPGAAKILWGTPGDWTRCVALLSKHLGVRAKGYCANRHKERNGFWPGDKRNLSNKSLLSTREIIRASAFAAKAEEARLRVYNPDLRVLPDYTEAREAGKVGAEFVIELVLPEGLHTGDKRYFPRGSIGIRNLPLPLLWQIKTGDGHDGSYIVGRIDRIERVPGAGGLRNAYGVFDVGPFGREAERLVRNEFLNWVSADLDKFEIDEGMSTKDTIYISKSRLVGCTLVSKPAFQECKIRLLTDF